VVDEVFVTVRYEPADLIRGRRLGLLTKVRDMSLVQFSAFLLLGIGGALFFAPAWLGQLVAAGGGSVILLAAVVFVWGWIRSGAAPPKVEGAVRIEVSDEGVFVKRPEGSARIAWGELDRVAYGLEVFMMFGRRSVLIPRRALRDDQLETLRALILAHEGEVGQEPEPEPQPEAPPPGKTDDAGA